MVMGWDNGGEGRTVMGRQKEGKNDGETMGNGGWVNVVVTDKQ